MPYKVVQKVNGRYRVVSLNSDGSIKNVHAENATRSNAWGQKRILDDAKYTGKDTKRKRGASV